LNRLELIDLDDPANPIVWAGAVHEFTEGAAGVYVDEEEMERLVSRGFVVIGGGDDEMFCLRYARSES
jgi:hypothetical protein